ncbi:hypothetical protein ACOMHN_057195 [Nucella lapillus]
MRRAGDTVSSKHSKLTMPHALTGLRRRQMMHAVAAALESKPQSSGAEVTVLCSPVMDLTMFFPVLYHSELSAVQSFIGRTWI